MVHFTPPWVIINNLLTSTGQDDDYYMDGRIIQRQRADEELGMWGVAVSIVSAVFMSAGLVLQKLVQRDAANDPNRPPVYTNSMYIAGIGYVCLGFLLRMFVHAILPLSAIAPLSSFTVIFTTLLEYIILKVEVDNLTLSCLSLVFLGTILSILGANIIDEEYSFETLRPMFLDRVSVITSVSLFAFIFTFREFLRHVGSSSSGLYDSPSGRALREYTSYNGFLGLVYLSATSAIFAGLFSTAVKTTVEIVKDGILNGFKPHLFRHPGVYLLALSLPAFGIPKMRYTWFALSLFHPLQFLPIYQSATIAANAMCGLVYYQDFSDVRIIGYRVVPALYFLGLGMVCVGLAAMTFKYNPKKHFPSITAMESCEESQSLMDTMAPIMDDAEHSFITTAGPPIGQMPHQYAPIPSYAEATATATAAAVGTGYSGGYSSTQEAKNPFEPNNRYGSHSAGAGTYAYQENPLRSSSSGSGSGRSFTVSDKEKFAMRGVGDERGVRIPSRTSLHSDSEHSQPTDEENMQYYSNPMNAGSSGRSSGMNSSLISSTSERSQNSLRSSGRSRGFGGFSNDWGSGTNGPVSGVQNDAYDSTLNPFTANLGTDLITEERLMRPDDPRNVSYNRQSQGHSQGQGQSNRAPVGPGPLNFNPNNTSNIIDRDRKNNRGPSPANQGPLFRGSMG